MTRADCQRLLATQPHHPSLTAEGLRLRLVRGWDEERALQTPVSPRPNRRFADAVAAYLAREAEAQHTEQPSITEKGARGSRAPLA